MNTLTHPNQDTPEVPEQHVADGGFESHTAVANGHSEDHSGAGDGMAYDYSRRAFEQIRPGQTVERSKIEDERVKAIELTKELENYRKARVAEIIGSASRTAPRKESKIRRFLSGVMSKLFIQPVVPSLLPQAQRQVIIDERRAVGEIIKTDDGAKHEFFMLDEHTWVWHKRWHESGEERSLTTRYEIKPGYILKSQGERSYHQVGSIEEERNVLDAVWFYWERARAFYNGQF